MTPFYRIVRLLAYPLVRFLFWLKPVGKESIPKTGGFILCCNHTSFLDIAFLVILCPRMIYFMGKEELFRNRFAGWFLRHMGGFAVLRGAGDRSALETAERHVCAGRVLGIFPEGTRSKDGRPMRAKSGVAVIAAKTGADVLPVSIYKKSGRFHPFCRVTVRFGRLIPNQELQCSEQSRAQIKRAAVHIMDAIKQQWELGA